MRSIVIRAIPLYVAVCLLSCSDAGDPYVYTADCDRSTGGIAFGAVPLGRFQDRALRISNSGNVDLVGSVALADEHFVVTSGGGDFVIPPEGSWDVEVRYAPKDTGNHRAEIELGNGCPPVDIAGFGNPPPEGPLCVADPPALAFIDVMTGQAAEESIEIRNEGLIRFDVDVALVGGSFLSIAEGAGPATLEAGDTLRVRVQFAPTSIGNTNALLTIGSTCDDVTVAANAVPPFTVSYAADIQPIFNTQCIICHSNRGSGNLDLRPLNSYNQLVNIISSGYAPARRVVPRNAVASVLFGKVSNSGTFGGVMPPNGVLPQAQQDRIETWINEGAMRN